MRDSITPLLSDPAAWAALVTLIAMEVVLGIDNLIFISILSNNLPEHQRQRVRRIGIGLALIMRLALLSIIANPLAFKLLTRWQRREKAEHAADKSGKQSVDDADELTHPPLPQTGHTLLVGYGRVGRQLATLLRERNVPLSVIDSDPDLVQQARNDGLAATRGNAASENRMAELFPEAATHALLAIPNAFEAGETLHTENSYKYSVAGFQALAERAGYQAGPVWTDAQDWFSLHWLQAPAL